MALLGEASRAVYRSAVAILRSASRAVGEGALAHRLIAIHGEIVGQAFQAFQAVARQAIRGVAAAERVSEAGAGVIPTRELPRGPESGVPGSPLTYRVLVRVKPADGSEEIAFAADLHEPGAISYAQVEQYVRDHMIDMTYRTSNKSRIRQLTADDRPVVTILSVNR